MIRNLRQLLALALGASIAIAQQPPSAKLRVAVTDLAGSGLKTQQSTSGSGGAMSLLPSSVQSNSVAIPAPAEFARGLTELLGSVLAKSGGFSVLDRAALQQPQQGQALAAGAQALISGDITGFSYSKSSVGGKMSGLMKGLSVSTERVTAQVVINLRLVDPSTNELIYSSKGEGKASQNGVAADLTRDDKSWSGGGGGAASTPLGQASREALENGVRALLAGMPKVEWTGRVIDVRNGVVYVNATAADGVQVGTILLVFERPPVDPATGRSPRAAERQVGSIVIDAVQEKFSTAKITKDEGIARGLVVRFKAP